MRRHDAHSVPPGKFLGATGDLFLVWNTPVGQLRSYNTTISIYVPDLPRRGSP